MSEDEPQKPASSDTLMAEATLWFGRMQGPEAEQHKPAFERWLARGALHRSFYNRAAEIYAMGKFLKDEQERGETGDEARSAAGNSRDARVRRGVLATVAVAAVLTIGFFALGGRTVPDASPEYARAGAAGTSFRLKTRTGQTLSQRLADGSRVTLSADSALLVDYDDAQRTLKLERGFSRFEVAHEMRPFVVLAGDGRITARGTIFEVGLRRDRQVIVRLLQGKVDVAAPGPASKGRYVRHLNAGESLAYPSAPAVAIGMPVAVAGTGPGPAAEPRSGGDVYQEFEGAPLAAVVEAANRYGSRPIRLAGSDLSGVKVSGRLRLNDPEKLARKIALLFDLEFSTGPEAEIILRRR